MCERGEREREIVVCAGENRSSFIFHWTCRFAYICLAQRRKIALVLISFARRRFILNPAHRTENGENPTILAHTSNSLPLAVVRPPVSRGILIERRTRIEKPPHTALLYDRHRDEHQRLHRVQLFFYTAGQSCDTLLHRGAKHIF